MTTNQIIHHTEQMAAARAEFAGWWFVEKQRRFLSMLSPVSLIEYEQTAWRAFLHAKGLRK